MEQKFIRAFGYVFTKNTYEQGLRYKLAPKEIVTCTIFFSRGLVEVSDIKTGSRGEDGCAGRMFKDTDFIFKEYNCHVIEPTVVYCYDELMNDNKKLSLLPIDLPQGQNSVFENGTKFLLCEGVLYINNVPFAAPAAISVTTGDKIVTPETRCLGLKIA
jgi:hypothetical protein